VLTWVRQPFLDRAAGAEHRAVDRRDRGTQRLCRFLGGEAEYVAEDEHGPLTRGKVLQRGDEVELEGLAPLVASLWGCVAIGAAEHVLRVRLDRRSDRVEAHVCRDPIQPGAERASAPELR
jgi:hypothetical protein